MKSSQVATLDSVMGMIDIFTSAFDNYDIIKIEHVEKMNNNATTGNVGIYKTTTT